MLDCSFRVGRSWVGFGTGGLALAFGGLALLVALGCWRWWVFWSWVGVGGGLELVAFDWSWWRLIGVGGVGGV